MHTDERTFDRAVETWLHDTFPQARVDYQVTFADTNRRADFVVEQTTPDGSDSLFYVVETEDDFAGLIESVGQALLYAAHFEHAVPIIAVPQDHFQQPEFHMLRDQASDIRFIEVDDS